MTETKTLKIARIRAENLRRWQVLSFEPLGRNVKVHGKNGTGKSTALATIYAAITGDAGSEPVRSGAERADLWVDLQDSVTGAVTHQIRRTWSAGGKMSLELRDGKGAKVKRPQTDVLDKIALPMCFNPDAWLSKRPQDQLDDFLRIFGVRPPVEKVRDITGEDFPTRPGESAAAYMERLSADHTGIFYVRRTEANRILEVKQKAYEEFRPALDGLSEQAPEQDLSDLLSERTALDKEREAKRALTTKAKEAAALHRDREIKLANLNLDLTRAEADVEMLRKRLKDAEDSAAKLRSRIAAGQTVVQELYDDSAAKAAKDDACPDPSPRIEEIDRLIESADKYRQAAAERKQAVETAARLSTEAADARQIHEHLEDCLAGLRELRRNLLNGIDLGIEGLSIGSGELRMGDAPFEQASRSHKIKVACSLLFRQKSSLRVLILDDAEHMDEDTEAVLMDLASKFGWECILAFVERGTNEMRTEILDS
jgi:DNA repair exonuclease SbcCD ATPase subunit